MGLFDLFGREPRETKERTGFRENAETEKAFAPKDTAEKKDAPVTVFVPNSFADVEKIIDRLKEGKNAVVHLNRLKKETAVRVLYLLSGAIYALGGGIYEMEKEVFMFSPSGLTVNQ